VQSPYHPILPNKAGDVIHWRKLYGASSSLAVAELAKQAVAELAKQAVAERANQAGLIVYVCSEAQHMRLVEKELAFFSENALPIFTFPDWECLPYDRVSPHPDIVSQRLLALHRVPQLDRGILIVPITALMQRLAPSSYIDAHTFSMSVDDEIDTESFRQRLIDAGYYSVDTVMSPGEFAIRGGVVDVFPAGVDTPFRLDLFDTQIETIRFFDTQSQRSSESVVHYLIFFLKTPLLCLKKA